MKRSVLLPLKRLTVITAVIFAGFLSAGQLQAQTGALITAFNFTLMPNYTESINQTNGTIVVPVYTSADITSLVAVFTTSPGATVKVGGVLQTSGVGARDFTGGVTYVVTSGDLATTKSYLVTASKNPSLADKQLLTFEFASISGATGVINQTDYSVQVTVPYSQSLTSLVATFTSSPFSTVYVGSTKQESGETANNFTSTVVYGVYAANGSLRNYYVTVSHAAPSSAKVLNSFSFQGLDPVVAGTINQTSHTVAASVPFGTDVTQLIATFTHSTGSSVLIGAIPQESGTTKNDFTNPVIYTVQAENNTTQDYTVTVTIQAASSAKDITAFSFNGLDPAVIGVIAGTDITLTVPYGTDVTQLVATFSHSPLSTVTVSGTPQVSGTTKNNFTSPVTYLVTAQNSSTKSYTVTVEETPALTGKSILTFSFNSFDPDVIGDISESLKTIDLTVPYGSDVTALVPTFTKSTGSTVLVADVEQESGVTDQDFTTPVTYTCKAQSGASQDYTVTVTITPPSKANFILTFNFVEGFDPAITGSINQTNKTISLEVPFSTDVTQLIATFTHSAYSAVKIGDTPQVTGVTENDFTSPVTYTCTAQDGSSEFYTVTVTKAPASKENSLISYNFETGFDPIVVGVVSGNTVTLTVPGSTDITELVGTFTVSPYARLYKGATLQESGVTKNDFSSPILFKCVSEEGSFDFYTVTVVKAPIQTGKNFLTFSFNSLVPAVNGTINATAHTIAVSVPFTTDVTKLVATFTLSTMAKAKIGTTVQVSGVTENDFSNPVTYTVTAENGTTQNWVVTVTKVPLSTAKEITEFKFVGIQITPIMGVINQTTGAISVTVPFGTSLTSRVATFTNSPLSVVRVGSTIQESGTTPNDFTSPVTYVVTAEDLSTKTYVVTVTVYVMPKQFLSFKFDTYTVIGADTVKYVANGSINNDTHVVLLNIPSSAQKSSLKAIFTLTPSTTAYIGTTPQVSGTTVNDFTSYRTYVLAATDGSTVEYEIRVINNPVDTQKQILAFSFSGFTPVVTGVVNESAKTIDLIVPFGTDRTAIVASYTTTSSLTRVKVNGVIQKSSTTVNNFTNPVHYRCYDENSDFTDYTVTVTVGAGSSAKSITYFAFEDLNPDVVGTINEGLGTITATVPNGVNRGAMRAFFTASPLSLVKVNNVVQQSGVTTNNFLATVAYEVVAQDGSTRIYMVNIGETADTTRPVVSNAIQTVSNLPGQFVLVRTNEATGKLYLIKENATQTTVAQLEAAVAAGLGRTVYVTAANVDHAISTANLPDGKYYAYAIDAAGNKSNRGTNAITVQDRLAPTVFVATQTKINALGAVVYVQSSEANSIVYLIHEDAVQLSKTDLDAAVTLHMGAKAFAGSAYSDIPVSVYNLVGGQYHAYAVDNSVYNNKSAPSTNIVTITEASHFKSILAFSFEELDPPVVGQITGQDISLKLIPHTPLTNLVATFLTSPSTHVYVGLIEQVSGVTPNDFTNPVVYKVTAEDGTSVNYTVMVKYDFSAVDVSEWQNRVKAYPNPVSDHLTIESVQPLGRLVIMNGAGQVVEDINNPGSNVVGIPVETWTQGIYYIRYYNQEKLVGIQKIIKD